jgi:membrane fusion protein
MSLFREEVLESRKDRLHGEVVLSQPLSTRVLVAVLFLVVAIAGLWVTWGSYARIENVPGILVTNVPSTKIVATQNGRINKLAVREGQSVKQGDTLLVINSDRRTTSGGDVAGRSLGALAARRQLSEAQMALADGRAAAERGRLTSVFQSATRQAQAFKDQIALQQKVVASNQQIFDQISKVVEQGFVSKVEFERRRQTLLGSQQALARLRQNLASSLSEADQARAQLASVSIEAAQGISRIKENLESMSAEEARLQGEQSYVITSPIDGKVTALATGQGRPANPGKPLMTIVPEGTKLSAELYAPTRAVGLVEKGKETRLLYDAFPYQKFGSFVGSVSYISRIAVDPRETDIPFPFQEPVYRIRVDLKDQAVEAYGDSVALQPGMTLQANIVLERQSFLAWILQPLNAVINRN